MLLILSLLLTVIEGARVTTAKIYAERALITAMDSTLAEYYGPLWEEYHIFGYYKGGSSQENEELMAADLTDYMSYTFHPYKDISNSMIKRGVELYDIEADQVQVADTTSIAAYGGELLINEAVEYMKYREVGDGVELLLHKMSLLDTPEKVSYIMEEKQKVEEKLVGIDQSLLELMELFDGLKTSNKGIEFTTDGTIATTPTFIKKICYKEITMKTVGINQESIFRAQENNYINPTIYFSQIDNDLSSIQIIRGQIATLDDEKEKQEQLLSGEQVILLKLEAIKRKTAQDKKKIKGSKDEIQSIKEIIGNLKTQRIEQEVKIDPLVNDIKYNKLAMSQLITEMKPLIDKAIICIDNILIQKDVAAPLINRYEELLKAERNLIDEKAYAGLEEDLAEIKKYVTTENEGYDFEGMKIALEGNKQILTLAEESLNQAMAELNNKEYQRTRISFHMAGSSLASYQLNYLVLDYSSMVPSKAQTDNPIKRVNNLLQGGILDLVVESDYVSDLQCTNMDLLPSNTIVKADKDSDIMSLLTSFLNNGVTGISNLDIGSLFTRLGENLNLTEILGDGVNSVAKRILYQEYLQDHFGRYVAEEKEMNSQKPSVLTYEQEYFLSGKSSDRENLASVVAKIVCLRTILDFASILGDKTKREEAKLVAASIVGFTGLPILIGIIQVLILIVWALAEALLDVSVLLMGKDVPILKKTIGMEMPEIFLMNREYLQKKAKAMTDTKELSFSYQDYLRVFLLLESNENLAYRSLDLIQENIRLRYQVEDFKSDQCLFSYEVNAEFVIKDKFTGFNFMRQYLGNREGNFRYRTKVTYSY